MKPLRWYHYIGALVLLVLSMTDVAAGPIPDVMLPQIIVEDPFGSVYVTPYGRNFYESYIPITVTEKPPTSVTEPYTGLLLLIGLSAALIRRKLCLKSSARHTT